MGLLSSIGKAIKGIFKGVGKIFKKVFRAVGKFLNSKFGKILMTVISFIPAIGAIAQGIKAFSATAGSFLTKFIAGAKGFVGALIQPFKQAKNALMGTADEVAQSTTTVGAASQAAEGSVQTANSAAESIGSGAGTAGVESNAMDTLAGGGYGGAKEAMSAALAPPASTAAAAAPAAGGGGFLSKAMDFIKSPGGGTLVGNVVSGIGQGMAQKALIAEQNKQARYYDKQWRDPKQTEALQNSVRNIDVPSGYLDRARRVSSFVEGRPYGSMPADTEDSNTVSSYALPPLPGGG